jgi:hypothetical protein
MPRPSFIPYPPALDFLRHLPGANVLQDDGLHVLVTTRGLRGVQLVDGALLRRHAFSQATPFGYECMGQYKRAADGGWRASLRADPQPLIFSTELDALVNLWSNRRRL